MSNPTFYLLHGDDDLGIDEALKKLQAQMGDDDLNTSEYDGQTASVAEVVNAVSSYPFLSDRRLVIVRGLLGWHGRKGAGKVGKQALEELAAAVPTLPESARLVLVERVTIPGKNAVLKAAADLASAYIQCFEAPKDATSWILKRANSEYGVQIDNRAAYALAEVTGSDLRRADNELLKLVSYVEGGRTITEQDVAALTPYVPEANIFKMVDAIAEGRGQLALDLLHRLMADKNQDPFSLFGMITRQFRLLLLAKEHLTSGGSPGSIASAVGVRPFVAQTLARQARGFTLEQLEEIYRTLGDYDLKMKTGRITPHLALDLFVTSLAR